MPVAEAAWIRAAPPSARMLAGYVRLRNPCKAAVALTMGYPLTGSDEMVNDYLRRTRRTHSVVERVFWG